ncbi:hypothetical protein D9M68_341780 [compost metagenome]
MTTQHMQSQACQVFLHPAAASNPEAIRAVQQATGRLVVLKGGKPQLGSTPLRSNFIFATGHVDPAGIAAYRRFLDDVDNTGPFGGDAA